MRVRRSVLSSLQSVTREPLLPVSETPLKNSKSTQESCKDTICKESVAFTLSTTGVLAIGDLGVHAIESLGVRVATNFVKMMKMKRKKVARNDSSNFDSSILILLAMLHRMVFASFSRSSE